VLARRLFPSKAANSRHTTLANGLDHDSCVVRESQLLVISNEYCATQDRTLLYGCDLS
jgi:hypothetical protein